MDSYFLGGDIGGTASRFVLCDQAGTIVQRGAAAGATGHTFNAESRDRLEESIAAIAAQITKPGDAAVFGLTGYGPRARCDIEDMLIAALKLTRARDARTGRGRHATAGVVQVRGGRHSERARSRGCARRAWTSSARVCGGRSPRLSLDLGCSGAWVWP